MIIPLPARLRVTLLVFEITPFMMSVPPAACVSVCVELAAAPRTIGASMVLMPLVFAALIALEAPVPVFVSVSLTPVFELVRSYPEDAVVEKFNVLMLRDPLRLGWVIAATLKTAVSLLPGAVPPDQLVPLLKLVPVLPQVTFAA